MIFSRRLIRRRQGRPATTAILALIATLSCSHSVFGQSEPTSKPAKAGTPADSAPIKPADTAPPPTDAEKITRLQRAVEESKKQVEGLTGKLNDPESEFQQADTAFSELDKKLGELRQRIAGLGEEDTAKRQDLEKDLADLEPKRKLAKDRFDLAIAERKTLQQQIATLQQKIQQDSDALMKLKGEKLPTSQPAAATPAAGTPTAATAGTPAQAAPPANQTTESAPPPVTVMPGVTLPAAAGTPVVTAETPKKLAPELVAARKEADRREAEAQSAQEDVASVADRIGALQKSIKLEHQLFENSRKKVENVQATERTLYESLQKKWQEGAPKDELKALQDQIRDARERLRDAQDEIHDRTDRLDKYQAELSALQAEHIAVIEEAQQKQSEAEKAQKLVAELQSPFSPRNLWRWVLEHGPRLLGIIVGMFVLLAMVRLGQKRLVRLLTLRSSGVSEEDRENRAQTLVGVFRSTAAVAIYGGGVLMILTELGVDIVPLMGGAAVVGLAVAFGAQNLIRDYFYGFMILLEQQYGVNDVVRISDVSGQVERITLRVTVLRGLDGTVHFIPNGEITRVSNMTHEWSRALFDIGVAYKEDVDRVMEELVSLAKELRRDPEFRGLILEMPEMLGVDEFADSAVIIKFFVKTRPLKQWVVKRELLRRIKKRFDELGIEIPFPHRTVFHQMGDSNNGLKDLLMTAGSGSDS